MNQTRKTLCPRIAFLPWRIGKLLKPTLRKTIRVSPLTVWLAFLHVQSSFAAPGGGAPASEPARSSEPIPWSEIGTKATAQYSGEGLSISAVEGGAVLRCLFQRMNARATAEGLWITSTVDGAKGEPFRVVAVAVGREGGSKRGQPCPREPQPRDSRTRLSALRALPATGRVEVAEMLARFVRPGVIEEYSVSMGGVRQDFVISERPDGSRELSQAMSLPTGLPNGTGAVGRRWVSERLGIGDESRVTQVIGRVERDGQRELERLESRLEQVYESNNGELEV